MLGVESEKVERVRSMGSHVQLYPLYPAYEELCRRFAETTDAGWQPGLFDGDFGPGDFVPGDFESRIKQKWSQFFVLYVHEYSNAYELRLVLDATIGPSGEGYPLIDASNTLRDYVRESRLPERFDILA